ncbi:MAG: pre-peptidase C-terminal domain-containing protein [Chloroflexota bacterium]
MKRFIRLLFFSLLLFLIILIQDGSIFTAAHSSSLSNGPRVRTSNGPDLIIHEIRLDPPSPGVGDTATIEVIVKNQGDSSASGFNVYLYIEPDNEPPTASTPSTSQTSYGIPLGPGGEFTWRRGDQSFTTDNPVIYAWVDPIWENQVSEIEDDNNRLRIPKEIRPDAYDRSGNGDDICENATHSDTEGTEQKHNLFRENDLSDSDWIKFDAKAGITYFARAIAEGDDADLMMEIHAECGGLPSMGNDAEIEFTPLHDSTYYLKIGHRNDTYGPDNDYRFVITSDSGCVKLKEPNDSCVLARELTLGVPQEQSFCTPGDPDWAYFSVQAGAKYKLTATETGAKANVHLSIYGSCSDVFNTDTGQELEFIAPSTGLYYVKAANQNATIHGADTTYNLTVERVGPNGCVEDSFEQDDNIGSASTVESNGTVQTHNICPAGDKDWSKFEASAGITYRIETLNLAKFSDTVLCLYAPDNEKIVCNNDGGAGDASRIVWTASVNGTYGLSVEDHNPQVAGEETEYSLRINTSLCDEDAQEPDNSRSTAQPIVAGGTLHNHDICPAGDEDWYVFDGTANTDYVIETTNVGPEADTVISLHDANGNLIAQNDDYAPGIGSRLGHRVTSAGKYYVKVRLYNPSTFGSGTEYSLKVYPGTAPTVTPVTPQPTVTPQATPTPQASGIRTLIVVNRTRLVELHGEEETSSLMDQLRELAKDERVLGEILQVEKNGDVSRAYAEWVSAWTDVDKANRVAASIRDLIVTYTKQREHVEYIVLVGDDRVLPFRRVPDKTERFPENTYRYSSGNHPTGAAQKANYVLTDDYYGDMTLPKQGQELYIPDLAIGRLIETPDEMQIVIKSFLDNPITSADNVLMSGYTFVQDLAAKNCEDWQTDQGINAVDCTLIGDSWSGQDLRDLQLRKTNPFRIQSISGHAAHFVEGVPNQSNLHAHEIADAEIDLSGGLIYTPGCHAGLNVPPTNMNPLDLPQAFAQKGANYVGNTGYGWGGIHGLGLSEKLLRLFTQQLLKGTNSSMGKALTEAKKLYYQQIKDPTPYDEKITLELTYYGLPMFQLATGATLSENEFPGVEFIPQLPGGALSDATVLTGTIDITFTEALNSESIFTLSATENGSYYALDQSVHAIPGQPIQPLHFSDISVPEQSARSVILRSASYKTEVNFEALVVAPHTEFYTGGENITSTFSSTTTLSNPTAWYPPTIANIQSHEGNSMLLTQIGQYQPQSKSLRIYNDAQYDIYYSISLDEVQPDVTVVSSLYREGSQVVNIKVDASDPSGIQRVVVSYFKDNPTAGTNINTVDLRFDTVTHKWKGTFAGDDSYQFYVQVVDNAGNTRTDTNKGINYRPVRINVESEHHLYLPIMAK